VAADTCFMFGRLDPGSGIDTGSLANLDDSFELGDFESESSNTSTDGTSNCMLTSLTLQCLGVTKDWSQAISDSVNLLCIIASERQRPVIVLMIVSCCRVFLLLSSSVPYANFSASATNSSILAVKGRSPSLSSGSSCVFQKW
jgi:hypothetical protein